MSCFQRASRMMIGGRTLSVTIVRQWSQLTTQKFPSIPPCFNRQPAAAIHATEPMRLFWEPDRMGGYNKNSKRVSRKQLILEGLQDLKQEIVLWKDEIKEKLESDPVLVYRPGETDVVWGFGNADDLSKWKVASDSDHNEGHSRCSLVSSAAGRGLFSGTLASTVPQDGKIKRAGYCSIKTNRARVRFVSRNLWVIYVNAFVTEII